MAPVGTTKALLLVIIEAMATSIYYLNIRHVWEQKLYLQQKVFCLCTEEDLVSRSFIQQELLKSVNLQSYPPNNPPNF